jgi:NADH-quinone oxidoreductase subunit C
VPNETKESNPVLPEFSTPTGANRSSAADTLVQIAEANSEPLLAAKPEPARTVSSPYAKPETEKPAARPESETTAPTAVVKPAAPAVAKSAPSATKPAPKPQGPKQEPWESQMVAKLRAHYGSGIKEASTYLGQQYLVVDSSVICEILLRMRDDELFDYCVDITAVHYPKRETQFDIVYVLYSFHNNERVRIKTQIKEGETLRSAFPIWPTSNWLEREVFDMFGITFEGHPDLKRILMPDGWTGHPLLKDYAILQQDHEWVKANLGIERTQ